MKNLISNSPTLPTQSMDGTLDQKYIIIDVTPAITFILEGKHGPMGSNHGSLQNPPLLALGHRALRDLLWCTVRG